MKVFINCWLLGVILLCTSGWDGLAQGTFQNLDFEMATLPVLAESLSGGFLSVPASSALPGWQAFVGGQPM